MVVINFALDLSLTLGASVALATTLVGVLSACNGLGRIVCGILRGAKPASLALMLVALWAFLGLSVLADGSFHGLAAALVLVSLALTLRKTVGPVLLIVLMALVAVAVRCT